LGKFEVIFCRNVLIYFSAEVKIHIINKFAEILSKDGYLFLGSSESMPQQCNKFKVINCQPGIIYQKL
jgi:chemotaxis protein methyltransferase CheR